MNEAYDGAGATYDPYWEVSQRDSLDAHGLRLVSSVHFQQGCDNAFWDGGQMMYGGGDGQLFNRFTLAVDVIGHELTHGVTQYTSNLSYGNQSGALNESFSAVFGSLVKHRHRGQRASEADWLIGKGLFTANVKGAALRLMKEPGSAYDDRMLGKDPQRAHVRDHVNTSKDNGGVHINSGIPNHAFYLTAGAMGGLAWEKAARVSYGQPRAASCAIRLAGCRDHLRRANKSAAPGERIHHRRRDADPFSIRAAAEPWKSMNGIHVNIDFVRSGGFAAIRVAAKPRLRDAWNSPGGTAGEAGE